MWLQLSINAFTLGSFYALVSLGFSLIYGVTHAFNLAHGELIVLSGYVAYGLHRFLEVPFLLTLPVCMLVLLGGGLLLNCLLKRVRGPFELHSLVVTFGLALVLQNAMLFLFSADYRLIRLSGPSLKIPALDVSLPPAHLILIVLSLLTTGVVHLTLRKTFLGKALRATIQDRESAKLAGIHVDQMSVIAFGMGGLLIGLAGPLFACTAYLHPSGGAEATLIAIIITIFAGLGRVRSILVGGWILGTVEVLATFMLGASWRELVSAVILILLLVLWPKGVLSGRTAV